MEDIKKISTFEKIPEEIKVFKNVYKLLDGSKYMIEIKDDNKEDVNEWKVISSLNLLFSIREIILQDLENYALISEWKNSKWSANINNNALVKILREIRNYNIHIELIKNKSKDQYVTIQSKGGKTTFEGIIENQIFFNQIDIKTLSKLRNVKKYNNISIEELEWFNKQSKYWSVSDLCQVAREVYYENIVRFIKEYNII